MISAQRRQVAHLFLFMSFCKGLPNTGAVPRAGKILAIMTSSAAVLSLLASHPRVRHAASLCGQPAA